MNKNKIRKSLITAAMAITLSVCLLLGGCGAKGSQEAVQPEENVDYEVALVTDDSLIMDVGHSEAAWQAITDFCAAHGISHKYYKAVEASDKAYTDVIDTAVTRGAKLIIAEGYTFRETIYEAQEKYPDTYFLILNSQPEDKHTGDTLIGKNTSAVKFDTSQAGYLAGYAAVAGGYTKLGFIGESDVDEISEYGYGFIKGADRAAARMNAEVTIRYRYCEGEEPDDSAMELAEKWYDKGTEVIMACGDSIENSVIRAAEAREGKFIGSTSDKSGISDTVLFSATINIKQAIDDILDEYNNDNYPGGRITEYNAANDGIGLVFNLNEFKNRFTQSGYDKLYKRMASGSLKIDLRGIEDVKDIKTTNVRIKSGSK